MVPDPRAKKRAKRPGGKKIVAKIPTKPSSNDTHEIVYFKRHAEDDERETIPGRVFLDSCPAPVQAHIIRVLIAVATAPPKKFAGGGYWEAMKSPMNGWHEVRVNGPRRRRADYKAVKALGKEYFK